MALTYELKAVFETYFCLALFSAHVCLPPAPPYFPLTQSYSPSQSDAWSWVGVSAVTRGIVLTRTKPRFTVHVVAKLPLIPLNRNPSARLVFSGVDPPSFDVQ